MTTKEDKKLALEDRRAILDAGFQLIKWLIATVFLLNGAAALATLGRAELPAIVAAAIALTFIVGVIASLTASVFLMLLLLISYAIVTPDIRWSQRTQHALKALLMVVTAMTLGSTAYGLGKFVDGVKMLAMASIEVTKKEQAEALAHAQSSRPASPSDSH